MPIPAPSSRPETPGPRLPEPARRLRRRLEMGTRAIALAVLAIVGSEPASAQFNSFRHDPRTILDGNWQSCEEKDGSYTERVYDHLVNGVGQFEVHLGPHLEFAIFSGVQDEHRAHDRDDNLLKPYRVPMVDGHASHRWTIPSLGLVFTVTLGGGSFTDCDSWYVTLAPESKSSD